MTIMVQLYLQEYADTPVSDKSLPFRWKMETDGVGSEAVGSEFEGDAFRQYLLL